MNDDIRWYLDGVLVNLQACALRARGICEYPSQEVDHKDEELSRATELKD